jgi:hypothetical protein
MTMARPTRKTYRLAEGEEFAKSKYPYIMSLEQKKVFLDLKKAGFGNNQACTELGITRTTLRNTFNLDVEFKDAVDTYSQSLEEMCEAVIFEAATSDAPVEDRVPFAERYLKLRRDRWLARTQMALTSRKLEANIAILQATVDNAQAQARKVSARLDALTPYELSRYNLLYEKTASGEHLSDEEIIEYYAYQKKVVGTGASTRDDAPPTIEINTVQELYQKSKLELEQEESK